MRLFLLLCLLHAVNCVFRDEAGTMDWNYQLVGHVQNEHIRWSDPLHVLVYSQEYKTMGVISTGDGSLKWRAYLPAKSVVKSFDLVEKDLVAYVIDDQFILWNITENVIKIQTVIENSKTVSNIVVEDYSVYFALDNHLHKIDIQSGKATWQSHLQKLSTVEKIELRGKIVLCRGNGAMVKIDAASGKVESSEKDSSKEPKNENLFFYGRNDCDLKKSKLSENETLHLWNCGELTLVNERDTGNLKLRQGTDWLWTRPEFLIKSKFAFAVELPEKILLKNSGDNANGIWQAMFQRWANHLRQIGSTPDDKQTVPETLMKDRFGFHQLVVLATSNGFLVALDTEFKGRIAWQKKLEGEILFLTLFQGVSTRHLPTVIAISQKEKYFNAWILNALTGDMVETREYRGKFKGAFKAKDDDNYWLLNHDLSLIEFPSASSSAMESPTVVTVIDNLELNGYKKTPDTKLKQLWKYRLPDREEFVAVAKRQSSDVAASIGRALGDRSVLYKYLNPSLLSLLTLQNQTLHVTLIDSSTGNLLKKLSIKNVVPDKSKIHVAQSENSIVVSYHKFTPRIKNSEDFDLLQAISSFEIYDQSFKPGLESTSNYHFASIDVHSKSFLFPLFINAISFTSTLNGITTKDLIVSTSDGDLKFIPRKLVDPRRPFKTAAEMSAEEKEEELIPYESVVNFDARNSLAYFNGIQNVDHIFTFPSALESTSLILAYGRDFFFTAHTPSKKFDQLGSDFSKGTLVVIVFALMVAIFVTRFLAKRKKFNNNWK